MEKFYTLNEEELVRFLEGHFENLEKFYESRDCLLELVHKIDKKIEKINQNCFEVSVVSDQQKREVLEAMSFKNDIVQRILAQDLQILSCIEEEKSRIIKDLKETKTVRKAIGAYKSGISFR